MLEAALMPIATGTKESLSFQTMTIVLQPQSMLTEPRSCNVLESKTPLPVLMAAPGEKEELMLPTKISISMETSSILTSAILHPLMTGIRQLQLVSLT